MCAYRENLWSRVFSDQEKSAVESAVIAGMPFAVLGIYSRWWQLESWLRTLTYVELRAQFGKDWVNQIENTALSRQERDKRRSYMANPDWDNPLAYLDAGKLFELILKHWNLVGESLIDQDALKGRQKELLAIRNRLGHLRRPHRDDLGRLEQTLRDLEPGASSAIASYNTKIAVPEDISDPVVDAWVHRTHPTAQRLIDHAASQYETFFELSYTKRPCAAPIPSGEAITGNPGYLWRASFYVRGGGISVRDLWRDSHLDRVAREVLLHVLVRGDYHVELVIPAVENGQEVSDAIGDFFDAVLTAKSFGVRALDFDDELPPLPPHDLDPRVLQDTAWNADESGSIFTAG